MSRIASISSFAVILMIIFACVSLGQMVLQVETVLIKGKTFTMGTPIQNKSDPEYHADEAPIKVTVADFRIGKYPVTAEQMCLFLNSPAAKEHDRTSLYNHNGGEYAFSTITLTADDQYVPRKEAAKSPANQVTWKGAVLFCKWLSEQTGKKYRLPAEAEWELAARGAELRPWPWGNEAPSKKHGRRHDPAQRYNSAELEELIKNKQPTWTTIPVGSYPANTTPEGVHDLLGYAIGEWCANKYVAHATADDMTNPQVDLTDLKSDRAIRGFVNRSASRASLLRPLLLRNWPLHLGRSWTRRHQHPIDDTKHAAWFGFRVVEELKP